MNNYPPGGQPPSSAAAAGGGGGGAWGFGPNNPNNMMPPASSQGMGNWQMPPQSQTPQQQQQQFGAAAGTGFNQPFANVQSHPMAQVGLEYGKNLMHSTAAHYVPGALALWTSLRYYFQVNNSYVKSKLKILLFPKKKDRQRRSVFSEEDEKVRSHVFLANVSNVPTDTHCNTDTGPLCPSCS
eukprot:gb/GECG01015526.1/.p1 GENE.gb/GECG01015526.1/~~gb/GECG01015526.1/.p1  ORF type:complete len:183 (+),score=21.87 gb/GECG01015526.1/:1-549(+)